MREMGRDPKPYVATEPHALVMDTKFILIRRDGRVELQRFATSGEARRFCHAQKDVYLRCLFQNPEIESLAEVWPKIVVYVSGSRVG